MFGNQKDDRVFALHRRPKQAGGVFWCAWNYDTQSGIMRERRFVGLAMPQTSAGKISSIRRVNHQRAFPIAERSPAQSRDVGDELVKPWVNEIDKLQLEHGAFAIGREAAPHSENGRLGERRIENLLGKLG